MFPKDLLHNPLVDYPGIHYSIIAVVAVLVVVFLWKKPFAVGGVLVNNFFGEDFPKRGKNR